MEKWVTDRSHDLDSVATARSRTAMLMSVLKVFTPPLVSPRTYYKKSDLLVNSFWSHVKLRRRPTAFMRFLGISVSMFDELVLLATPFLQAYDRKGGVGRPSTFDVQDVVALALRRYQISGRRLLEVLEVEFGYTKGVISPALAAGREALHKAVDM